VGKCKDLGSLNDVEEEIQFGEFTSENQYPEQDQADFILFVDGQIAGGEGLTGEVLS